MVTVLFVAYFMTWVGLWREEEGGEGADCDGGGGGGEMSVMGW
jgi:hypothetical protein